MATQSFTASAGVLPTDAGGIEAVLLDRDGTLIVDIPALNDPRRVTAIPGARTALERLRAHGLPIGVITNQAAIGRQTVSKSQLAAVNACVERLLGPFATWQICPHDDSAGCGCRKPRPGLVHAAAAALGTTPQRCVVVGDRARDVEAAHAAGATAILVPSTATLRPELWTCPTVVATLNDAADLILKTLSRTETRLPGTVGSRTGSAVA